MSFVLYMPFVCPYPLYAIPFMSFTLIYEKYTVYNVSSHIRYDGKDFAKVPSNHLKTSMVLRFLDMALAISLTSYSILFFLYDKNYPRCELFYYEKGGFGHNTPGV